MLCLLAIGMSFVDQFRDRTVAFILSKGSKISPDDFRPYLSCVQGRMEGFGTVGCVMYGT